MSAGLKYELAQAQQINKYCVVDRIDEAAAIYVALMCEWWRAL